MPKRRFKIRKGFFRLIHLQAVVALAVYFILSNYIFVTSVAHPNIYISFFVPLIFGTLSSFAFLYLFSHKDFFHFIANLEKEEEKNENKYLGRFAHYGKIIACMFVSAAGGPIFLALTIRFLFSDDENRYLIAFISILIPTLIMVAFAKGFIKLIF
ncbi:MAG TPA: hypothetical protein VMR19_04285 [Candidatus Saccharimonadales bacterium]|jgi:hypothetical protein|nr:hypothetical protein [Candidatus Saccharimonadales bacterium]